MRLRHTLLLLLCLPTTLHASCSDNAREATRAKVDGAKAKPKSKPDSTSAVTGGSVGSLSEGYAANQAGDLSGAC